MRPIAVCAGSNANRAVLVAVAGAEPALECPEIDRAREHNIEGVRRSAKSGRLVQTIDRSDNDVS